MTGNVVRSADGIVTSAGGRPVTSGTGIIGIEQVEQAQRAAESAASDSGRDMGVGTVSGYTTVSGGGDRGGDGPSESTGRSSTSEAAASEDAYGGSDTFFAMGGRVGMQEGGVPAEQVPPGEAPVATEAGFVKTEPENVSPAETVADDQALEVPEGTFVLNAAAVEFMGSADVKKMILDAMQEAEKQGIDIKQDNAKIAKEDLVSLVVSKGEVIIPPQLAEIIGYDRLNKINNRGKAEVQRRSDEQEQMKEAAPTPPILAKRGGFIAMKDGGKSFDPEQSIVEYHYNTIKEGRVGRDEQGRPITVYSRSIYVPEGKNKGKFALVPGYVEGSIEYTEDQLYEKWKDQIDAGKWPIDETGPESGKRAQRIHQIMDRDADSMPELKRETPPK
jgi:hypothetical protein